VRAVLDPNVLISALLSPTGRPARLVLRWLAGDFELVVSERLVAEVARALTYPKLRSRVTPEESQGFVELLRRSATVLPDPRNPTRRSSDRGDDYLVALAEAASARLVSGDRHLLRLAPEFPIESAAGFLERLGPEDSDGWG
jgi:putative PIN family toxin of toxin-antitoxin system